MTIERDMNERNQCRGKRRFGTEGAALDGRIQPEDDREPYFCYSCGAWHLGYRFDDPTKGK